MQRAGSANFISRAALYLVLASSFYVAGPLHLRFRRRLDRQHREHPMVGTITPIYCCEESLLIRGLCITYRACPQGARSRQNDNGVARPAGYPPGGARVIGTSPAGHWTVCCCATVRRLPCSDFSLDRRGAGHGSGFFINTPPPPPPSIPFSGRLFTTHYFTSPSLFLDITDLVSFI